MDEHGSSDSGPTDVEADVEVSVSPAISTAAPVAVVSARQYPSLYDSTSTTLAAIAMGVLIVGGVQVSVARMYATSKTEQQYLTRFVTSLVALVIGTYIADLLIAGPDTSLLSDDEHTIILGFVKDVCLMVFAYYFGTQSKKES